MPEISYIFLNGWGRRPPTPFPVYTRDEADELGLEYVYWKDAQIGQMALSDDGYVAQCRDRRQYKTPHGHFFIKTAMGSRWSNTPLFWEESRDEKGRISKSSKGPWIKSSLAILRTQVSLWTLAQLMVRCGGQFPPDEQMLIVARIVSPSISDKKRCLSYYRKLIRQADSLEYLSRALAHILFGNVTQKDIDARWNRFFELAEEKARSDTPEGLKALELMQKTLVHLSSEMPRLLPSSPEEEYEDAEYEEVEDFNPVDPAQLPTGGYNGNHEGSLPQEQGQARLVNG